MAREKTERLLNLLIALSSSSRPVTREELRQWLIDQYGSDQSPEAFEKMFERDKDELRGMGIPIETVVNAHNEVVGYRIERSRLKMTQLEFSTAELAVLNAAAAVWSSASASSPTRSAILKLEASSGAILKDSSLVSFLATEFPEGVLGVLLESINEHRIVAFDYQKNDGSRSRREVAPWGVVSRDGHWYLVGLDQDRQEPRVFRLSRILGQVTKGANTESRPPANLDVSTLIGKQDSHAKARVVAEPGKALPLRRRAHIEDSATTFDVEYDNVQFLFREVLRYAPYVHIEGPEELKKEFISHLKSVGGATHE